jgi:hypothetical protein
MKQLFLSIMMGLSLLSLISCGSKDNNHYLAGETQSCVDFGGGCDPFIIQTLQSPALRPYPTDAQGRLQGASSQNIGGVVYYSNFDGCSQETVQTYYGDSVRRYIPVILPRNGGLACLDSFALDLSGNFNPNHGLYNFNPEQLMFNEWDMYNYVPMGANYQRSNVFTHYINLVPGQNSGTNNNNTGWGYINFSQHKATQYSAVLPLTCDLRHGDNSTNPDCHGRTCVRPTNPYVSTGAYFGVCVNQ